MEWALAIAINCTQPRLPFKAFYERVYHVTYPGHFGEDMGSVNRRMAEAMGSYIDYAEAHRDQCRASMCYANGKSWVARAVTNVGVGGVGYWVPVCRAEDEPK